MAVVKAGVYWEYLMAGYFLVVLEDTEPEHGTMAPCVAVPVGTRRTTPAIHVRAAVGALQRPQVLHQPAVDDLFERARAAAR